MIPPAEEDKMASSKQKTTYSKLQREASKRERRAEKAARKDARKNAPPEPAVPVEFDADALDDNTADPAASEPSS
jgi:hypothetical protein